MALATDQFLAAELPYVESDLSMVVIAPRQDTLAGFGPPAGPTFLRRQGTILTTKATVAEDVAPE